jgi:dTDP-4-dehydrorhamnose 3,5-epimerase-like enzyme
MSLIEWIDLGEIADERGALVAIEGGRDVPFDIRRVYFLHAMRQDAPRGFHAHRKLRQVMVCVAGSCRVRLDDDREREDTVLDTPRRGLLIREMVWHEMHDFSSDCVLLVLASEHYDEADYIRDYDRFIESARAS